jgi:hypothetical protein
MPMAWPTPVKVAAAVTVYSLWASTALEPDDGDAMLGWTLGFDLLAACAVGAILRREPQGERWALRAVSLGTVLGVAALWALIASWDSGDTGGLLGLTYGIFSLIHLAMLAPMAYLAKRIVRRSQRRFPLEAPSIPPEPTR